MNNGSSSLNANAASYIPLCRRVAAGENKVQSFTAKDSDSRNATVSSGSHPGNISLGHHQNNASQNYLDHGIPASEDYTLKGNTSHGAYGSSSKSPKALSDKDFLDEDFDMDLAYLQMTFPGFSDESLFHIYLANRGDLENTVDMLSQLELCTGDSSENLPDTLEIGDMAEPQSSKECTSSKLKGVVGEIAGSSGSTNQHSLPHN